MKNLFKHLPLLLLSLSLVACGDNDSGKSRSSSSSFQAVNPGESGFGTSGQNFTSLESLRSAFEGRSLESGLQDDINIYHVGTYFGGSFSSSNTGSVNVNFTGCINLIFWEVGDCDNQGGYDYSSQLQTILNQGRFYRVSSAQSNAVSVEVAESVLNNDFVYGTRTFDRNDSIYREMLSLSTTNVLQTRLANASIKLVNGESIPAQLVEYFYGNSVGNITSMKRFVVSTNIPVLANPIMAQTYYSNSSQNKWGYLANIGTNIHVQSITLDKMHGVNMQGQIQEYSGQTITIRH